MSELFVLMLTAILAENFIFIKFYGICPFLGVSDDSEKAFGMGCAVTFVMTVSGAVTWALYEFVLAPLGLEYLKTVAFILVIASLVQLIEMLLHKILPSLYSSLGIFLPLITTNCAVLGSSLLCVQRSYSFIQTVAYCFAAAIGFTMAILIFAGVRERLEQCDAPKSFKGMPLTLITAALVAMVFSGFSGINFA